MSIPMSVRRLVLVSVSVMMVFALYAGSAGWTTAAPSPVPEGASLSLNLPSAEDLAVLPSGASGIAAEINGQELVWNVVDGGIALSLGGPIGAGGPVVYGFCTYAVTSALFALGSVGLAAAAASGGLVVAGIFLGPAFLTQASLAAGSFSALYGLVAAFVC